jgi:hypothetical protein
VQWELPEESKSQLALDLAKINDGVLSLKKDIETKREHVQAAFAAQVDLSVALKSPSYFMTVLVRSIFQLSSILIHLFIYLYVHACIVIKLDLFIYMCKHLLS